MTNGQTTNDKELAVLEVVDASEPVEEASVEKFDALTALTRIAVGGVIEGSDELLHRLQAWQETAREGMQQGGRLPNHSDRDLFRFALVGLLFAGEEKTRKGLSALGKLSNQAIASVGETASPVLGQTRLARSVKRRFNALVARGQKQVGNWAQRGAIEEPLSRQMLREAIGGTVDDFIEHLAENEELQDLVQKQSIGLAEEMVNETRRRTITADDIVERLVRALLRRPQREELPEPSPAVKSMAAPLSQINREENG